MPPIRKQSYESTVELPLGPGIKAWINVTGPLTLVISATSEFSASQADAMIVQFANDLRQAATGP